MNVDIAKLIITNDKILNRIESNDLTYELFRELVIIEIISKEFEEFSSTNISKSFTNLVDLNFDDKHFLRKKDKRGKSRIATMMTNIVTSNANAKQGLENRTELNYRKVEGTRFYKSSSIINMLRQESNSLEMKMHINRSYDVFFNLESLIREALLPQKNYLVAEKCRCEHSFHNTKYTFPLLDLEKLSEREIIFYYKCRECIIKEMFGRN